MKKPDRPENHWVSAYTIFMQCPKRKVAKANKVTPLPDSGGGLENRLSATSGASDTFDWQAIENPN